MADFMIFAMMFLLIAWDVVPRLPAYTGSIDAAVALVERASLPALTLEGTEP